MKPQDKLPSLTTLEEDIQRFQRKEAASSVRKPQGAGLGAAMSAGAGIASGVLVGAGAGIMLDRWLGTAPVLLLVCTGLGAAASGLTLYRAARAMEKDDGNTDGQDTKSE